jgi:hypothetical protein
MILDSKQLVANPIGEPRRKIWLKLWYRTVCESREP